LNKIDLANPKTDVEKLYHEFVKWWSSCDRNFGRRFDNVNVSVWISGTYDLEDANILINIWESCGLIRKVSNEEYYNYEIINK
jgi:hypothetical protein